MTTRTAFNQALQELRDDVLRMGSMVDLAIDNAMRALKESNLPLAQQIITEDEKINELRFDIEEDCVKLIARQQPMASDLRTIITAMNIALELERMGDHARALPWWCSAWAASLPSNHSLTFPAWPIFRASYYAKVWMRFCPGILIKLGPWPNVMTRLINFTAKFSMSW